MSSFKGFAPVVAFALLGLFFTYQLRAILIDRQPLEMIVVTAEKKPVFPIPYYLCKHYYPLITQHGAFMRCYGGVPIVPTYREDI